ncbi:hypothetical protein K469DRAFT_690701 [Zopfia rhizophila CBS 207.26]|uniref:Uncharacterized protein n=1 Tax=Zopfia rhizophila CBS 207.26 TaxID=1314779 RepID=A0A6A6DSK4_9PEZI|nr:hypothetical protein K469DRAFT_690701 [Zopfia rhizophila CBS 207.26]
MINLVEVARNKVRTVCAGCSSVIPIFGNLIQYEALHLARQCIAYFDRPKKYLNDTHLNAVEIFRRNKKQLGRRIGWIDGSRAMSKERLMDILMILNDIFFFGAIRLFEFEWAPKLAAERTIDPDEYDENPWEGNSKGRKLVRLSSLLQEALHEFLELYTCGTCETFKSNIGRDGHGRAWQSVTAKLEEFVPQLLSFEWFLGEMRA